jgi:predicted Zn-dependent protease
MRRPQLIIAVVIALIGLMSYFGMQSENPVTGEKQRVAGITPEQEVALGLQSAPQMAQEFGGLDADENAQNLVDAVGQAIVQRSAASKSPYQFDFHLLADPQTVNAFALPGGQIFITRALYDQLRNEAQLGGVLGHEIGHVVGRHSAEHMAKQQLTGALVGAAGVAASDPNDPYQGQRAAQMAAFVGQIVNMKYGRDDEIESDVLGVRFMGDTGYDPREMIEVMRVLEKAGGGGNTPEFFSTHPNPGNRSQIIEQEIQKLYPNGVPPQVTTGRQLR